MRALIFVDLDDTLFQTLRKCPPNVPEAALTPLGFDRQGEALSFATPRQAAFLRWISEGAMVIPVTARSRDALGRVELPWTAAICAHGGVILDAGGADREWAAIVRGEAAACRRDLEALAAQMSAAAQGAPISVRLLEEDGDVLYVLAKHADADAEALAAAVEKVRPQLPDGWTLHLNGNNAAFLPPFLGKARAVAYLLERLRRLHPDAPAVGIGDSLTDAPFMALCDFAMMPTASQLAAAALNRLAG